MTMTEASRVKRIMVSSVVLGNEARFNAVLTLSADGSTLITVEPFEQELHSTPYVDGIVFSPHVFDVVSLTGKSLSDATAEIASSPPGSGTDLHHIELKSLRTKTLSELCMDL